MKKQLIYIIGIAATLFAACENISEDERFIVIEDSVVDNDSIVGTDSIQIIPRIVLLEDYTGQACVNCPSAHEMASILHEQYNNQLVVVSMHAGPLASPAPNGLMQEEGNVYADKFGIKAYPVGMVNRNGLSDYSSWPSLVRESIEDNSIVNISLASKLVGENLSVNVDLFTVDSLGVAGKLQLWLVEDSIVAPQAGAGLQYIHNHVFRDALNSTWGEDISLTLGEQKVIEHKNFTLDAAWKPENLSVVAFVYNNEGVLQAAQCKVVVNE